MLRIFKTACLCSKPFRTPSSQGSKGRLRVNPQTEGVRQTGTVAFRRLVRVYRRFWRGCKWEKFLLPDAKGFEFSRKRPQTHVDIGNLQRRPGVYEFAISKGGNRRYKTYVGESGSMQKRHQTYARTGDHLLPLFDAALKNGCIIWRRCKYIKTKEKAVAREAKLLRKYDYCWNARQNTRKRNISIVSRSLCLCFASMHVIEEPVITPSDWARALPSGRTAQPQKKATRRGGRDSGLWNSI